MSSIRILPLLFARFALLARFVLLALFAGVFSLPAQAELRHFSDAELIDGFVKTVFGAEYGSGTPGSELRLKKFTGPVRIHIVVLPSAQLPDPLARQRKKEAEAVIRLLAQRIKGIQIRTVPHLAQANLLLMITDSVNYQQVGREMLGERADFMGKTTCASVAQWKKNYAMDRGLAMVIGDKGSRTLLSCVAEEIAQLMGPVNDSADLAYSTFNDSNDFDGFPLFDQFILNMIYDRRIRPGMSAEEARAVLPAVLATIRPRVEAAARKRNPHAGQAIEGLVWD
jgi:hypothetical protein